MGEYSNTYNVIMVANAISYSIVYNDGVVSNMPTDTTGTSPTTSLTLSSDTPVRSGYEFIGWCDGTVTTTNNVDSCSGTTYAAGGTYTLDGTTTNNISLTAMWEVPVINFTIKTTPYQASRNMTWSEWIDSEYNTASIEYKYGGVWSNDHGGYVADSAYCGTDVKLDEAIINGFNYGIREPGPC